MAERDKKEKTPEELAAEEAAKAAKQMEELNRRVENGRVRARANRWLAAHKSLVSHPDYGSVIVPHLSKFAAIENAAEFWGCDVREIIRTAEVAIVGMDDGPVRRPKEFYKAR